MWNATKKLLGQLLSSKKFVTTLAAVIVWLVGRLGFDVAASDLIPVLSAMLGFVVAQGLADFGKEGKKLSVEGLKELSKDDGLVDPTAA